MSPALTSVCRPLGKVQHFKIHSDGKTFECGARRFDRLACEYRHMIHCYSLDDVVLRYLSEALLDNLKLGMPVPV